MNIYDEAHTLAKSLKESDELNRLKQAEEVLKKDEEAKKIAVDYLLEQEKIQYMTAMGEKTEDSYKKLQEMAVLVSNNSIAQEYVQAFIRWNQLISDVHKIVMEAMTGKGMELLKEAVGRK